MISKLSIITLLGMLMLIAAPAAALPDLLVTEVNAYHYDYAKTGSAWFNLTNYVDVTVKNNDTTAAGAFNVSLYADGEFIGEQSVAGLNSGSSETLVFEWKPIGIDEQDGGSPHTYSMLAEADPYNAVSESNETNNNMTAGETAKYNGYMADEPLNTTAHGRLRGGLLFTTGDGSYIGETGPGLMGRPVQYNVDIPPTSSVELAKLNVYYTWAKLWSPYPDLRVEITNQTGTYNLSLETAYHDRACSHSSWNLPWGNFVYDVSDYITGSGGYTVTIYNNGTGYQRLSMAAPGLAVIYRDDSMPQIEYWLAEGTDVLIGGRRSDGGYLSLEECINNATFEGHIDTGKVRNAVLGTVSPWGESGANPNVLYFNGIEIGRCVYDNGYNAIGDISLGSIRMTGTGRGQVGVNLSNVTSYLSASVNIAGQGDGGDCMMPSNAFLVMEYEPPEAPIPFLISGRVNDDDGNPVNDPDVVITNTNTGEEFVVEIDAGSNYYQVMTGSCNVSTGDEISLGVNGSTATSHAVTSAEMDAGGFEQNFPVQTGTCGDVDGLPGVTTNDGRQIFMYLLYGADKYPIHDHWAADCDGLCDGITTNDGRQIFMNLLYGEGLYPLECCS